jgi:hypothetical protein
MFQKDGFVFTSGKATFGPVEVIVWEGGINVAIRDSAIGELNVILPIQPTVARAREIGQMFEALIETIDKMPKLGTARRTTDVLPTKMDNRDARIKELNTKDGISDEEIDELDVLHAMTEAERWERTDLGHCENHAPSIISDRWQCQNCMLQMCATCKETHQPCT